MKKLYIPKPDPTELKQEIENFLDEREQQITFDTKEELIDFIETQSDEFFAPYLQYTVQVTKRNDDIRKMSEHEKLLYKLSNQIDYFFDEESEEWNHYQNKIRKLLYRSTGKELVVKHTREVSDKKKN